MIIALGIGPDACRRIAFWPRMSWSQRVISLVQPNNKSRFLARFTGGLMGKLEEYAENAEEDSKGIPEITLLTICMLDTQRVRMVFSRFSTRDNADRLAWLLPASSVGHSFRLCSYNACRHWFPRRCGGRRLLVTGHQHRSGFRFRSAFPCFVDN